MTRSSQHDAAVVDGVPPLNGEADANVESAPFAHVIVIGPISVGVSVRWLTAVVLMATIALALMVGALCSTLGSHAQFAAAPVLARRVATGAAFSRGDRLATVQAQDDGLTRARIEQLDDSRLGPKPFTHVIAHLDQPVPPVAPVAAIASPHPSASRDVAARPAAAAALPHEIRFGNSHPNATAQPAHASAYAPPDDTLATHPLALPPTDAINVTVIGKAKAQVQDLQHVIVARAGDTLQQILGALGTAGHDADAIASLLVPHKWFGREAFAGGETITVLQERRSGTAGRLHKVSIARTGKSEVAAALSDTGRYVPVVAGDAAAARAPRHRAADDLRLRPTSGASLRESLDALAQSSRIDRALIDEMLRLCGHDVDLDAPASPRDRAELLYSCLLYTSRCV